jgi:hypothetical protein
MNCPKCDADVSETYEPDDPLVGICGGWFCDACDLGIGEHEYPHEPLEGDVEIPSRQGDRTEISERRSHNYQDTGAKG